MNSSMAQTQGIGITLGKMVGDTVDERSNDVFSTSIGYILQVGKLQASGDMIFI